MVDCTTDDVLKFDHLITYLRRLTDDGITPLIEKQLLGMLDSAIDFTCYLSHTTCFPELERLTVNRRVLGRNKRITHISQLKYPPAEKVTKYGRCNMKGQSILYSAFGMISVYSELKPLRGDLITISKWRVRGDSTVRYMPIFKNQPTDGTMNPRMHMHNQAYNIKLKDYPSNLQRKIELINQFVADAFTKRIDPRNDLDYLFSAYFSHRILNRDFDDEIDAIYYPSVQQGLAFENLAVRPDVFDAKYDLIEVRESIVMMDHTSRQGGTFSQGISDSKSFDYAGDKILWKPTLLTESEIKAFERDFDYER